jgi:hypothetical protein
LNSHHTADIDAVCSEGPVSALITEMCAVQHRLLPALSCHSSDSATLQRGFRIADIHEQRSNLTVALTVEGQTCLMRLQR